MQQVESQIAEWRTAILRGGTVDEADADELESHLRDQISELEGAGLSGDEAFLIAVRRLGEVDVITAEFAREHSDRLWKQLAMPADDRSRRPLFVMLGFAVVAAVLAQVARTVSGVPQSSPSGSWFVRDISLFVLPVPVAYFAVARRLSSARTLALLGVVAAFALLVNLPFERSGQMDALVGIHLPVALWLVVGAAYVGGDIRSSSARMNFIRFTGEWVIYYALIALGGGVLTGLTMLVLTPFGAEAVNAVFTWVLPSGAAAAVIVAAWLVEAKKSVIENLAPVLTAIFTPLFAVMLVVAAVSYTIAGVWRDFDRELLAGFDVLLLVVLGLVVYGISARAASRKAGAMDIIRLVAVSAAVVLDSLVVVSMFVRVGEFGLTPNRIAALGINLLLLINLAVTVWLIARLLAGRTPAVRLERWQTGYLAVFAAWVVLVVLALPPLFGFA